MNANETQKLLSRLQVGWPRTEITDEVVEFYEWGLGDVPYEAALEAAQRWVRAGNPFFPTVSELRGIIAKASLGNLIPEAVWSEIRREAVKHPYGVPKIFDAALNKTIPNPGPSFSHPLIAAAVEATGWRLICQSDDETEVKNQFTWTLKKLSEQAMTETKLAPMDFGSTPAITEPANVRQLRGKAS